MGTSEFAVPILKALFENKKHDIKKVYTKPPKKAGRGYKVTRSCVDEFAIQVGLEVSYPKTLKDPEILEEIKALGIDAIVVASYGKIVPDSILNSCKYGCINVHPSALPRWRGASPVERGLLAMDKKTQVCIMKMDSGIDTGDVFLRKDVDIEKGVKAGDLQKKLAIIGGELLLEVLENIHNLKPIKQSEEGAIYAKKLEKDEGLINWKDHSAEYILAMIKAFDPWPGCFFEYKNEKIRILDAAVDISKANEAPGTVVDDKLSIACAGDKGGVLKPLILQRPGKKAMPLKDFLNGYKIPKGISLY